MKQSINFAEIDLKLFRQKSETNDRIVIVMEPFLKEAKSRYETLECMFNKMTSTYKELADYFAFDANKYAIGEFFADLRTFAQQFELCKEENLALKEAEEKQRRTEEERKMREKEKYERKCHKERLLMQPKQNIDLNDTGDTGVMDNLLEALQSGKLFDSSSSNLNMSALNRTKRTTQRNDARRNAGEDPRTQYSRKSCVKTQNHYACFRRKNATNYALLRVKHV